MVLVLISLCLLPLVSDSGVGKMTCTLRVIALFGVSKYLLTVVQQSLLLLCFTDDTHTESYIALFGVRQHAHRELYSTVWCQSLLLLHFADNTPDNTHTESYIALFGVSLASSSILQTTRTLRVMTLFGVSLTSSFISQMTCTLRVI
ncbi:hypothetical protein BDR06DRAFT_969769 [Suillus hirtellus]|nr:hypothetical protein BDR06DRAFT_969769 [Suillus hirtellus]